MENGGAAPTGCYKCGRPGHWSRDCPSNPTSNPSDTNPKTTPYSFKSGGGVGTAASKAASGDKSSEKPKKVPRSRPKLSPELLLSNDGIGYVLRHFPGAFKYHGRGHEVSDLGNLLGLYAEWHSHLIPYYSFNQFVHKVEQVGASKRVKVCLRNLQEKVATGSDPTKLDEPAVEHEISNLEQETMNLDEPSLFPKDTSMQNNETDGVPEVLLEEIYEQTTEEPSQNLQADITSDNNIAHQVSDNNDNCHNENNGESRESQLTEEQKARMEANKLKALERAAARARDQASHTATT